MAGKMRSLVSCGAAALGLPSGIVVEVQPKRRRDES
jgi:hypothetical protein